MDIYRQIAFAVIRLLELAGRQWQSVVDIGTDSYSIKLIGRLYKGFFKTL
jgi:hypothetical protein